MVILLKKDEKTEKYRTSIKSSFLSLLFFIEIPIISYHPHSISQVKKTLRFREVKRPEQGYTAEPKSECRSVK